MIIIGVTTFTVPYLVAHVVMHLAFVAGRVIHF